jgi:glycosyltransferase involved in cell wall biosynthesis
MKEAFREPPERRLRIACHIMGGEGWIGGQTYLKGLFQAVRQLPAGQVSLSLLVPAGDQKALEYARSLEADNLVLYPPLRRSRPRWAVHGLIRRVLSRDLVVEAALKKRRIDAVFGPAVVYRYPGVATLSCLPDFQHLHLPEMFSWAERRRRDQTFLRSARAATRVILLNAAAQSDLESFAPRYAHKGRIVRPASCIPEAVYDDNVSEVVERYHLPEKFVYLPNQFWKHKQHVVAFHALKTLKERGVKVTVVCSGYPWDYRHPMHFADLWQQAARWDIRDLVVYLGVIPHEDVLRLMRQSVCVLNPSLFEGWGLTVEEARAVGKRVVLSDIPAHREHHAPKAAFFAPGDSGELAAKLAEIWLAAPPGPDLALEAEARKALPRRLQTYGEGFVAVAREAVEELRSH